MTYLHNSRRDRLRWVRDRRGRLSSLFVAGCAVLLVGCDESSYPSNKTINFDETQRDLFVQPIQVCNDFGQGCARVNLFADITAKILKQARLKVNFLPTRQLHESRFLTINDRSSRNPKISEFSELARSGGTGDYGRHPDSTRDSGPINVWFVDDIESDNGFTQFGLAYVDGNGVIISGETLDYNGGEGRVDTLAHEIGHNLGLSHSSHGAGDANNLLSSGNKRNVPSDIDDVYPNGAGVSQLTLAQLNEIVNSPLVNPNASDSSHAHASDDLHSHALEGSHAHDFDGPHFHASDGSHSHALDSHTLDSSHLSKTAAADLSTFTIASLSVGTEEDVHQIPEPSTWGAIALVGLSSLLLLKRQENTRRENMLGAIVPVSAQAVSAYDGATSCVMCSLQLDGKKL